MCEVLGVRKTRTTPLHPQSDGMVERMNRTMGRYLSKVVSEHQRDWDEYLHLFLLAYRSSVNESTGETPANVVFGRELRLPCDLQYGLRPDECVAGEDYVSSLRKRMNEIHEKVRRNISEASDRMKERYDVKAERGGFTPGELVWLHNPRRRRGYSPKLQNSWEGPYEVISRLNDVIYRIKKKPNGKPKIVHFNRLAPYKGDHDQQEEHQVKNLSTESRDVVPERRGNKGLRLLYKDIFTLPAEYALAHCVAADLRMSRGIATVFRKKFGGIEDLERQSPTIGTTLHLERSGQHLFYLVTKETSNMKPTYQSLKESLQDLREKLLQIGIKKLAIPRLGCGYDGLEWKTVKNMVGELFMDTDIEVVVCVYNPWCTKDVHPGDSKPETASVLGQNSLKEGVVLRTEPRARTMASRRAVSKGFVCDRAWDKQ